MKETSREYVVLGVESTAHTLSVGIVTSKGRILGMASKEYIPKTGGIHPREAAQNHARYASIVVREVFKKAKLKPIDVDVVAYSAGPGLGPCLRTGATIARALASYLDKPLVPVNHCLAHIELGKMLTGASDPLVVYVSGGNTIISAYSGGRYRVFGETLDIALGNCLDVFAREVGIAPPYVREGLHVVDYYALKGREIVDLPYVVKGQDMSFSGLLTAALKAYAKGVSLEDLCLSFREVAYNSVVEVAERALSHTGKEEILLTGGVAKSPVLKEKFERVAEERGVTLYVTPPEYAGDNGVMIAWTGALLYDWGVMVEVERSTIRQRWRLDEVEVPWMR